MTHRNRAMAPVDKLATCKKCGDSQVAWVLSKKGKWYLATAYAIRQGTSQEFHFMVNKADPHFKQCKPAQPKPAQPAQATLEQDADAFNRRWAEMKNEYARREQQQEREAFASDPDMKLTKALWMLTEKMKEAR